MARADDLPRPLSDVTFVVIDLETTGGSPHSCAITEVGAVKFRHGEIVGTFETLVDPGIAIPYEITYLTGITEAMVAPAPRIESVLPALLEFIGDAVVVGHNVRFDLAFLRANLARLGYRSLTNPSVDTCILARRLVKDEVPDCRLGTVARHLGARTTPCHRAMADALATGDVLHSLLERVASLGVSALDDLLALPRTAAHPQVAKLHWVDGLPRTPGVYLFSDGSGRVIHVGRANDLRQRVRSYFASDDRRRIAPMLREAQRLDHEPCRDELEAIVKSSRLVRRHSPRFNPEVPRQRQYRYVREAPNGRVAVTRQVRPVDRGRYVGPFTTSAQARTAIAAGVTSAARDRLPAAIRHSLVRQDRAEALVRAGRVEIEFDTGQRAVIVDGRLQTTPAPTSAATAAPRPLGGPIDLEEFDEIDAVASWLDRHASRLRIVHAELGWSCGGPPGAPDVVEAVA